MIFAISIIEKGIATGAGRVAFQAVTKTNLNPIFWHLPSQRVSEEDYY